MDRQVVKRVEFFSRVVRGEFGDVADGARGVSEDYEDGHFAKKNAGDDGGVGSWGGGLIVTVKNRFKFSDAASEVRRQMRIGLWKDPTVFGELRPRRL